MIGQVLYLEAEGHGVRAPSRARVVLSWMVGIGVQIPDPNPSESIMGGAWGAITRSRYACHVA